MLLEITRFSDIDARKLMDVYSESNYDNTDYFFPDTRDKKEAVRKVEDGFLELKNVDIFSTVLLDYSLIKRYN